MENTVVQNCDFNSWTIY